MDMVRENNVMRLREIQERIIGDNLNFQNIDNVSLTTIDRVLKRQRVRMKQAYRVPFERNSDRIKHLRHQYVQVSTVQSMYTVAYSTLHAILYYRTVMCCIDCLSEHLKTLFVSTEDLRVGVHGQTP